MPPGLILFIRSLGFGGLLGCGVACILFLIFPQIFPAFITLNTVATVGGIVGTSFHRVIDNVIVKQILGPISANITYVGKLIQIEHMKKRGMITEETSLELKDKLTKKYWLNE